MRNAKHHLDQPAGTAHGKAAVIMLIAVSFLITGQSVRARGFVAVGGGGRGFVAAGGGYRGGYAYRGYGYHGYGYRGFGYGVGAAGYRSALPLGYHYGLPAGAAAVAVMGHRYYYADGVYYNPVFYGGSTVYVVANP